MIQQFPVIIVVTPLVAAFVIVAVRQRYERACRVLSLSSLFICLVLSVMVFYAVSESGVIRYHLGGWVPPYGIEYRLDQFNALMMVLISFLSLLGAFYAQKSIEKEIPEKTQLFWGLYLLLAAGLFGISASGDMFNLFVLLEVASLTGYALVAIGSGEAAFAGFRYLIIGTIGASFYLLGVGYLYIAAGTLNMEDLRHILPTMYGSPVIKTAFVFIFIGFSVKIALFPLHAWQPNAYTHSPSAVTVIISTAAAKTFAYALIRVIFSVFTLDFIFQIFTAFQAVCWLSAFAIIFGSVFAIQRNNLKKMLAYSSIANVGYIMLGVGLSPSTSLGLSPAVIHMVNHGIIKGGMFMAACGFIHRLDLVDIRDFEGLSAKMPLTSLALIVTALAMIGMPPGGGFVSKWYLILAALEAGEYVFVGVIFASTLLMIVYFLRVIEIMYVRAGDGRKTSGPSPGAEMPLSMLLPCLLLGVLSFALGVFWISGFSTPILESINAGFGLGEAP